MSSNKVLKIKMDDDGSEYSYYNNFISESECKNIKDELTDMIPWKYEVRIVDSKRVKTARLVYSMCSTEDTMLGEVSDGVVTKNDGTVTTTKKNSIEWSPFIFELKKKIEKNIKQKFLVAKLHFFRDGNDYYGFHSSNSIKENGFIALVFIGIERSLTFRQKNPVETLNSESSSQGYEVRLTNGSLILVNENAAKINWKYAIPKSNSIFPCFVLVFN